MGVTVRKGPTEVTVNVSSPDARLDKLADRLEGIHRDDLLFARRVRLFWVTLRRCLWFALFLPLVGIPGYLWRDAIVAALRSLFE